MAKRDIKETPGIMGCYCIGLYWAVRGTYEIEPRFSFRFSFCFRYGVDMWWGWQTQEDRGLTAAVQNTRNAPARLLAHGVAECASRQQQQQQRGGEGGRGKSRCEYRRREFCIRYCRGTTGEGRLAIFARRRTVR